MQSHVTLRKFFSVITILLLFLHPFAALGITNTFTTQTLVGDDTSPPTVPTALTATPVSTTQINLAWASSTDDNILSGYHIWRDDVQIATTTTSTYSDTGLTPSTLYTYYVTAFDSFFNISASSSVVATTTLTPAPPEPSDDDDDDSDNGPFFGNINRSLADELLSLRVLPQQTSARLLFETHGFVKSVVRWGRTSSYEMGSLAESNFTKSHDTFISGLTPNTLYYFTIEGENRIGRYGTMHVGTFMTLPPDDTFPPGNVTNLRAVRDGDDVVLSWVNPTDPDLAKLRVIRSDLFYPSDIADGRVIYEGLNEGVRDRGAALEGDFQYYTVFSYDDLGNISSGAVVRIYLGDDPIPPPIVDPTQNEIELDFDDIIFIQEGITLPIIDDRVEIDGAKHLSIEIPYARFPEHLKTILVVLDSALNPNETFSFIMRINADKTAYTSTLAPLGFSGRFPIQVSIFDFKTSQIGYTNGALVSHIQTTDPNDTDTGGGILGTIGFLFLSFFNSYVVWFMILLILLLAFLRRFMRTI